jgi:hypothetical protein
MSIVNDRLNLTNKQTGLTEKQRSSSGTTQPQPQSPPPELDGNVGSQNAGFFGSFFSGKKKKVVTLETVILDKTVKFAQF